MRRLSSAFSCARLANAPSSDCTLAAVSARRPAISACSAETKDASSLAGSGVRSASVGERGTSFSLHDEDLPLKQKGLQEPQCMRRRTSRGVTETPLKRTSKIASLTTR